MTWRPASAGRPSFQYTRSPITCTCDKRTACSTSAAALMGERQLPYGATIGGTVNVSGRRP